jgi:dTMP kinase
VSTTRGKFITFEGLDGTGKSTQIAKLAKALRARGHSVVVTREPGGTAAGEKIRHVILDSATTGLDPMAEMALMFASRSQHIAEVIEPALASGKTVLCDRFTDSTEAYQGGGRRLGSKPVLALHRILCRDLQPDLTILLDFDLATSLERARRRNQAKSEKAKTHKAANSHKDENRFEQENRNFFGRVRHAYQAIARREPGRVALVDAGGTPGQTHAKVLEAVRKKLRLD